VSRFFVRSTRRVALTPEGERLVAHAHQLLALHDQALRELLEPARPVIVDLLSEGRLTGRRMLDAARESAPQLEFRGQYAGGFGAARQALIAGEVDVAFGRALGPLPPDLVSRLVRLEPMALLVPETHPLAARELIPIAELRGLELDAGIGNPRAPEWLELAQQLLAFAGAYATAAHVPAEGPEEQVHHLTRQGLPILTGLDHRLVVGGVIRRLTDPVLLYAWSMVYRRSAHAGAIAALEAAAAQFARDEGWLDVPAGAWLPEPEATNLARELHADG
jgi:DNA-binding transcriptional LysR family regulator